MKKRVSIIALFVSCFAICLAASTDLNGKWKGILKFGDMELPLTYTFQVEGESLSGVVTSDQGDLPIADGKIKGSDFTFSLDIGGNVMPHAGKFYGDSTIITSEFNGMKTHLKLTRAQ
ncbi:hypothetical protein B0I27_105256 [Arcticibacter pallidicorallinus]|uniref:Glycoside hydrolase n=1 Tax=Arcticibacter pallidicorallinus TaxID=1259464 RepID=A0A2T0U4E0_9SPHI|nr:glycoside hydrolase [Arcticibacter pallidicorallinus]PRY52787.1 hypothetical protein B0I27_105256 [Arcticibacter pallidicorallinus]